MSEVAPPSPDKEPTPLVSIVIPCYNQAHFLSDAIQSVLAQTYAHFEMVVVDDGSSDTTSEVAGSFPRARCIRQDNQGLAEARNVGLRASRGDYVVFLDADDRLLPKALKIGVEALESKPECAFAYGHCALVSAHGDRLFTPKQIPINAEHYLNLLRRCYIWTPGTVIFRRSVLESLAGFDISVSPTADYEIYLRLARQFPVYCHDQVVLEYRQHDANMSSNSRLMFDAVLPVLLRQRDHVKGNEDLEKALGDGFRFYQVYYRDFLVQEVRARVARRTRQLDLRLAEISETRERQSLIREWQALYDWTSGTVHMAYSLATPVPVGWDPESLSRLLDEANRAADPTAQLKEQLALAVHEKQIALGRLTRLRQCLRALKSKASELWRGVAKALDTVDARRGDGGDAWKDLNSLRLRWDGLAKFYQVVNRAVPPTASVAVVSKGDEALLYLGGRSVSHFPQLPDGKYAGHHPADGREAIEQLEAVRAKGAEYLMFPSPSLWWLEYYEELAAHLSSHYRVVAQEDGICVIYNLVKPLDRAGDTEGETNRLTPAAHRADAVQTAT